MSTYKKIRTKKGVIQYYEYGASGRPHLISIAKVSKQLAAILENLAEGGTYDDSPQPAVVNVQVTKDCLFCKMPGTKRRYVNLQMVYLCEEHYQNQTTGEVAKQIKELRYAKEEKEV